MHDYEERTYKGFTICIEYYGKTANSKNARRYFIKDKDGKKIKDIYNKDVFPSLYKCKYLINEPTLRRSKHEFIK